MATTTVPTTITAEAAELAKRLGVELELELILERGRESVRGLNNLEVVADTLSDMGEAIHIIATVDPEPIEHESLHKWWCWRIEQFGPVVASHFVIAFYPDELVNGR